MPGETYLRREGQAFVGAQTAWNTIKQPVASEAFRFTKITMQETIERDPRTDVVGTRSRGASIEGRTTVSWSVSGFAMGAGSAGTAPDIGELIKAIFGVETAGGNVVYTFMKDLETTQLGLTLTHFGQHMMMMVKNCIVNELTYTVSGGDQSTFEVSGEATTLIRAGSSTVGASQSAGASIVQVAAGDGAKYSAGAKIKVNGVSGHEIASVSGDVLTLVGTVTAAQVVSEPVTPDEPTGTTAGTPISKVRGTFDLGGTTYKILSGSIKISDPSKIRNDEFGTAIASGFDSVGIREVSFETSMRLLKGNFNLYGSAVLKAQKTLNLTIGDTAGSRLKFAMPAVEITPPSVDSPDDDPAVFSVSGIALPTANENELTLTSD